jgi:GNAT superfamily N-acetyltransferase
MHTDLSRLVAGSIRSYVESRPADRVGPFAVLLDPHTDNVWRNYAVPDDDATPSAADVAALVRHFAQHSRVPRLEYVPAAAPRVEPALAAAGFVVEGRPPLMACGVGELAATPTVDGFSIAPVESDADLFDVASVQNIAYGEEEPAGEADVARLRRAVERGGWVVLARAAPTGEPAGAGVCSEPAEGVSELAAVGVTPAFRRRGVATAVVAALVEAAHAGGARTVWLEPAGEREAKIYERAGFRPSGEKLWISLPSGPPQPGATDFDHGGAQH